MRKKILYIAFLPSIILLFSEILFSAKETTLLINNLRNKDINIKRDAQARLINMGKNATEPLLEAIKKEKDDIKISIVHILSYINDKRIVNPLINLLNSEKLKKQHPGKKGEVEGEIIFGESLKN